ncbi:hypothetical protein NFI96_001396 [Prochilodus magdalenae]|nr:hypothetical protein NFI96_001396 [Prochilodus magdalenae]
MCSFSFFLPFTFFSITSLTSISSAPSASFSPYSFFSITSLTSFRSAPSLTMNGLSVSELCCLFCCPPCPSRIAAKLAFLPPEPTYALLPDLEGGTVQTGSTTGSSLRSRGGGGGGGTGGGGGGGGGGGTAGEGRWKLHLTERAEFQYSQRELDITEVFLTRSTRGNRVGCMYIRCAPTARLRD